MIFFFLLHFWIINGHSWVSMLELIFSNGCQLCLIELTFVSSFLRRWKSYSIFVFRKPLDYCANRNKWGKRKIIQYSFLFLLTLTIYSLIVNLSHIVNQTIALCSLTLVTPNLIFSYLISYLFFLKKQKQINQRILSNIDSSSFFYNKTNHASLHASLIMFNVILY